MRAFLVGVIGGGGAVLLVRSARRYPVRDRLRPLRPIAFVPPRVGAQVAGALDAAAIDMSVEQAMQTWALVAVVVGLLGFGLGGSVIAASGVVLVGIGGPVLVHGARHRRARLVEAAVPAAIDLVASDLRAGGTVASSVSDIARRQGPLAGDFARMEARMRLGASLDESLHEWAAERRVEGVDAVAGALAVCAEVGGPAADALDALASSLRDRLAVIAEAHALSAQARMSAVVMGGAPLAYLAWSVLVDPSSMHALVGTAIGRVCVVVGVLLELMGGWWMRRIIQAGSVL